MLVGSAFVILSLSLSLSLFPTRILSIGSLALARSRQLPKVPEIDEAAAAR